MSRALAPGNADLQIGSDPPREYIHASARTFFATTTTSPRTNQRRALLQSDRNATLPIEVRRSYVAAKKFRLHDFVVMPGHVHLLLTGGGDKTIEKACSSSRAGARAVCN